MSGFCDGVDCLVGGRVVGMDVRWVGGRGEGGEESLAVFKINIQAVKHLKINILAWVPRKINKYSCSHQIQIGYILK